MARRLFQAAALALLVVCSDSLNATSPPPAVERLHVGRGSIAAGGAHTVIATPDGRVFAWGSGSRGQLGNGTLVDRLTPTVVPDLGAVIAVTAGAAHTVALTEIGDVYAWGANTFGRLGDATQKRRTKPVRVKGLNHVKMVAAGRAHTLALTVDGRVFAWGRNASGQIGNGRKGNALVPVEVPGLTRVVAIAAGDAHSLAVSDDGRVFAWGRNLFSALGDGATKNRLTPVVVGMRDVVSVAAGGAHSIALTRSGAVYSWGRGANGELGTGSTRVASTPKLIAGLQASAIEAGRHFSAAITTDGRLVAWGANGSGQLGDGTLDRRLRPVQVRGVESVESVSLGALHAAAVTRTGDVRTWGEGGSGRLGSGGIQNRPAPVEIISDVPDWGLSPGDEPAPVDTTPPTIVPSTSPPLVEGWMTAAVTVSFACADDVEVASCSGPVTVSADGGGQRITGTAVDRSGNTATATVVVNLDLLPPVFSISSPAEGSSTAEEEIVVTGSLVDAGSGITDSRCNGKPMPLLNGLVSCSASLKPGRNDIILEATDMVGHSVSTAILVTRIGTSTALTLSPATRRMAAGEVAQLLLRDEFGAAVSEAFWSSSDEAIVDLTDDDPPVLTAVGIGTAVIRAEKEGLIAEAAITVVPVLMAGDTRWTLPATPLLSAEPPLFANRVAPDVPHLFTVESPDWGQALLRAVSSEGEVLWQQHVSGVPFLGDSFGGVIAGATDDKGDFRALLRLGGGTAKPWRYDSPGILERPAQAHDGALYLLESVPTGAANRNGREIVDTYATVIDGMTGRLISRHLLPREVDQFTSDRDGDVIPGTPPIICRSYRDEYAPDTVGPVAGSDGRGYFIVRRHQLLKRGGCTEPVLRRPDRSIAMGLDLVVMSPTAPPQYIELFSAACEGMLGTTLPCDLPVRAIQMMPDGIGGTVVTWQRATHMVGNAVFVQKSMTRIDADGTIAERNVARNFSLEMMGQGGTAITYGDGWTALDVRTGEIKWSSLLPGMTVMAARPDGGVAMFDWSTSELKMSDATGAIESAQPFDLDWRSVHDTGDWIGLRGGELAAVMGDFQDATRWKTLGGNEAGQLRERQPGKGIFGKTHLAFPSPFDVIRYRHVSIRVVPLDWQLWVERGIAMRGTDEFENAFFTIGAGSNSTDTNARCAGTLVSDVNREADYLTPPWDPIEKLAYSPEAEDLLIQALLDRDAAYKDDLPYACRPEENPGYYNSNSFAHGLLNAVGLSGPRLPGRLPSLVPGWRTPVPKPRFQ